MSLFPTGRNGSDEMCCRMNSTVSGIVHATSTRCQFFSLDTEQEPNRRMYNQLRVWERAQTNSMLCRRGTRERSGHYIRRWRAWRRTL